MTETIIILAAWLIFMFYGCIVAYIVKDYSQQCQVSKLAYAGSFYSKRAKPEVTYLLASVKQPLLLPMPIEGIREAESFISKLSSIYNGIYDFDYLKDYLTCHFTKYEYGRLPPQSGQVIYTGEQVKYTLNFKDCQDIRILKYIKPVIRLLNETKHNKAATKRFNVLTEANQVLKSKRIRKVKEVITA